jgi:hypothetical protein
MADSRVEHADGCDLDFTAEVTSDAELPPGSGGVQQALQRVEDAPSYDADGCDLDFGSGALTEDAELPVSTGGVA